MIYSQYFGNRRSTFEKSFELILKHISDKPNSIYRIVELGTSRSFVSGRIESDSKKYKPHDVSSWDWGAGIFTKVFSDNLINHTSNFLLQTVDTSQKALFVSKVINKSIDNIQYINDFSTSFLRNIDGQVNFIYMDHAESSEETCQLHLEDSKIIVERNLISSGGIILIDDVQYPDFLVSKGRLSLPYLLDNEFSLIIGDYQVLLVKN